jgi:hypothetical protein
MCKSEEAVRIEMENYLAKPVIPPTDNPDAWWSTQREQHPTLAVVARKYLSAPASSVPSEQLFSGVGNIVTDKRSLLTGKKTEMLVALKYNIRFLDYSY